MWMEDSEKEDLNKETLFRQFSIVRKETNTSHVQACGSLLLPYYYSYEIFVTDCLIVQEYGDLTIGKMKVAEFQGKGVKPAVASNGRKFVSPLLDAVPSGDVPLAILRNQMKTTNSNEEAADIVKKIRQIEKVIELHKKKKKKLHRIFCNRPLSVKQKRQHLMDVLGEIVKKATNGDDAKTEAILTQRSKLTDFNCYEELVQAFSKHCFHLSKVRAI